MTKCNMLFLFAAVGMLAFSLSACGNASPTASPSSSETVSITSSGASPSSNSGGTSESAQESSTASTEEASSAHAEGASTTSASAAKVDYADYSGYQFLGNDPWDGKLTITVKKIADDTMTWTFTDAFEDHTLYCEVDGTPLDNGKCAFDIQGTDVEHDNVTFAYQGTLELRDGKVAVTFDSGAVATASSEGGESYRFAEALPDSGLSNQVVLDRVADGPYEPYLVQEGDSVHSIAEAHGISTKDLVILNQVAIAQEAQANGLHYDNPADYAKHLFPGEELLVPCA